jgi:hypothetical protein
MKGRLTQFDTAIESYLAKLAGEAVETQTRQAEGVRIHYQSKEAALLVPAGQAAVTGAFFGLTLGVVAVLAGWPKPWAWALITWLLIQAGAWLFLLRDWRKIVLYRLENALQRDLTGDLVIGNPQTVKIELSENEGRSVKFINLPGDPESLAELARGVLNGSTLAESNWTKNGRPFTRYQFAELRSELIRRGLAEWNSPGTPARGVCLTRTGRAVMAYLAKAPSPSNEDDPEND